MKKLVKYKTVKKLAKYNFGKNLTESSQSYPIKLKEENVNTCKDGYQRFQTIEVMVITA